MKYIIKPISDDFLHEELEQVRRQFVEALNNKMETATLLFDKPAKDPLDFYIAFDFQQNNDDLVIYGFNLREELLRNFKLDSNKYHTSQSLLTISEQLKSLALEIDARYAAHSAQTLAEYQDDKATAYAKNINRSYSDVLRDALAEDEKTRKYTIHTPDQAYQSQTILLNNNADN